MVILQHTAAVKHTIKLYCPNHNNIQNSFYKISKCEKLY